MLRTVAREDAVALAEQSHLRLILRSKVEVWGNNRHPTESYQLHQVFQLLLHMDQPTIILHQVCMTSTKGMYLAVRVMVDRSGAQHALIGNWTEPTIAAKSIDVYARWTIFALGKPSEPTHLCQATDEIQIRVGGIVSETSQKFFVLFVCWGSIYCVFVLILMAKFVAERAVSRFFFYSISASYSSSGLMPWAASMPGPQQCKTIIISDLRVYDSMHGMLIRRNSYQRRRD